VQTFPSNIVAGMFGFRPQEYFEIELASEREAPEMHLSQAPGTP